MTTAVLNICSGQNGNYFAAGQWEIFGAGVIFLAFGFELC